MPSLHRNDEAKTELCVTVSKSLSLDFFRPQGLKVAKLLGPPGGVHRGPKTVEVSRRPMPTFHAPKSGNMAFLLRKEVIQPQVPLRLPCYDFIPVTAHTLDGRAGFGYKRLP